MSTLTRRDISTPLTNEEWDARHRKHPKQFSAYEVTASDSPEVPVGTCLTDKGNLTVRVWDFVDFETGHTSSIVGKRIARLCRRCRIEHRRGTPLGHEGPCTPETTSIGGAS